MNYYFFNEQNPAEGLVDTEFFYSSYSDAGSEYVIACNEELTGYAIKLNSEEEAMAFINEQENWEDKELTYTPQGLYRT